MRLPVASLPPSPSRLPASTEVMPLPPLRRQWGRLLRVFLNSLGMVLLLSLGDGVCSSLLWSYPALVIVIQISTIILCSNVVGFQLRRYYHVPLDQLLTTLHLRAVRVAPPNPQEEHANQLEDTTAYLAALRVRRVSGHPTHQLAPETERRRCAR